MIKDLTPPVIICFGEILWDNLPNGRMAGGAPMNVAYHLNKLGADSKLISRIGTDAAGDELIAFCHQIGLSTALVQHDEKYLTGEVIGKLKENYEMVYDIVMPSAWDYIRYQRDFQGLAELSNAFVFGSLACRNNESRNTLMEILAYAPFKVLDINLRAPHYKRDSLELLLHQADLLKLNDDEVGILSDWFYKKNAEEKNLVAYLQEKYQIREVIVTRGSAGAGYYSETESHEGHAYPVNVIDTVGAGDSFLAAFLYKKLTGTGVAETLDFALAMGAFIAGKAGACPAYKTEELLEFKINTNI